jgi:hypothetical protein
VHVVCKEFGNSASSAQADSGAHAKLPYAVPLENSRYCEIHEVYKISGEDSVLYFLLQLGMLFKPDSSTIYARSSFVWLGNFYGTETTEAMWSSTTFTTQIVVKKLKVRSCPSPCNSLYSLQDYILSSLLTHLLNCHCVEWVCSNRGIFMSLLFGSVLLLQGLTLSSKLYP